MRIGCYMCGAPSCPNDPDNDGVGNWDRFDGLILANASEAEALERVVALLWAISEDEYRYTADEYEQQRLLTKLSSVAIDLYNHLAPVARRGGKNERRQ